MSAAELALQSMKKRGAAVPDSGSADKGASSTEAKTQGGGGGEKPAEGSPAVAGAAPEPLPAVQLQAYTGKDFEQLYGHPDRWACLDSSEVYEDEHVLVMKTHSFTSKCVAVAVWAMSFACIGSAPWAVYVYANANNDPVSPRYYQSKLCEAVTLVNEGLAEKYNTNATLLLDGCDLSGTMVIPVIGDLFWVIWAVLTTAMVFAGCCAPPDRMIVLEKEADTGCVSEIQTGDCGAAAFSAPWLLFFLSSQWPSSSSSSSSMEASFLLCL